MSHKQAKAARKAGFKKSPVKADFHVADIGHQQALLSKYFSAIPSAIGYESAQIALRNRVAKHLGRSKYQPHQGAQECARRVRQLFSRSQGLIPAHHVKATYSLRSNHNKRIGVT